MDSKHFYCNFSCLECSKNNLLQFTSAIHLKDIALSCYLQVICNAIIRQYG